MTDVLSNKIKIASWICTVMVVLRHSLNNYAFFGHPEMEGLTGYVQMGFSQITDIAVPFFFIVSGFFFFRHSYYSNGAYNAMLKKKAKTLLYPFLIWNFIGVLILLVYDRKMLGNSLIEYIVNFITSQYYGPLWYVRDLMIWMALVPLYGWLFNYRIRWGLPFIIFTLFYIWNPGTSNILTTEGLFFFLVGGVLSSDSTMLRKIINRYILLLLFGVWISISFNIYTWGTPYLHKFNILLGLLVFWNLFDYIPQRLSEKLLSLSSYSFLIYVMHFYIEKVIKVLVGKFFFNNELASLLFYFLIPIIVVCLIIAIGQLLRQRYFKLFSIITGNR